MRTKSGYVSHNITVDYNFGPYVDCQVRWGYDFQVRWIEMRRGEFRWGDNYQLRWDEVRWWLPIATTKMTKTTTTKTTTIKIINWWVYCDIFGHQLFVCLLLNRKLKSTTCATRSCACIVISLVTHSFLILRSFGITPRPFLFLLSTLPTFNISINRYSWIPF